MFIYKYIVFTLLTFAIGLGISLQEVFDAAQPLNGYDKYLVLENGEVYSGGLGIYEGTNFIDGKGAIVDLHQGQGIWIYGSESYPSDLKIQYVNIINGAEYGITFAGTSTGSIENCNFYNNDFGAKFYDTVEVEVKNSNFVQCGTYGLGIYSMEPEIEISYCNFWDNVNDDLMENCPN